MDKVYIYIYIYISLIHFAEYAVGSLARFCSKTIQKVVLKILMVCYMKKFNILRCIRVLDHP